MSTVLLIAGLVMVLGAAQLAWTGRLRVLQPRDRKAALDSMTTFAGKLEFTAKHWILGLVWLYVHLHLVIWNRVTKKAVNPLYSETEDRVTAAKFIFTNRSVCSRRYNLY